MVNLFFLLSSYLTLILAGNIHQNPGPHDQFCRVLYSNIRGLNKNLHELSILSTDYDIICCAETLVSDMRHVSEILIPGFSKPVLLRRKSIPRAQGMCVYICSNFNAARSSRHECG